MRDHARKKGQLMHENSLSNREETPLLMDTQRFLPVDADL